MFVLTRSHMLSSSRTLGDHIQQGSIAIKLTRLIVCILRDTRVTMCIHTPVHIPLRASWVICRKMGHCWPFKKWVPVQEQDTGAYQGLACCTLNRLTESLIELSNASSSSSSACWYVWLWDILEKCYHNTFQYLINVVIMSWYYHSILMTKKKILMWLSWDISFWG